MAEILDNEELLVKCLNSDLAKNEIYYCLWARYSDRAHPPLRHKMALSMRVVLFVPRHVTRHVISLQLSITTSVYFEQNYNSTRASAEKHRLTKTPHLILFGGKVSLKIACNPS
jgi:hypothetical protein